MHIDLNKFELSTPSKRKEMMENALKQEMVGTNFESQNQSEQASIWKNAVYNVWTKHAHCAIFAEEFIAAYGDNDFTLFYLIQSITNDNDIASIVQLCNTLENLSRQDPHLHRSVSRVVSDFAAAHRVCDPLIRLDELCNAGLSPFNVRYYCYTLAMLDEKNWDACVAKTQQSEPEFLFNALRFATKDFSNWGAYHMVEKWPKLLSLAQWETQIKTMPSTSKFQRPAWIVNALSNPPPKPFADDARSVEYVLKMFSGPCLEENISHWNAIALSLDMYRTLHEHVEQRIAQSAVAHQQQHINAAIDASGARSSVRKM